MKKNISINIGGIIFHIEEDGFEKLKEYLDSINKYFSTFEDSSEIIADIESRIAEIFLAKLNEGKQVITFDDVSSLIATMGSIQDFQAVEDSEILPDQEPEKEKEEKRKGDSKSEREPRKLVRDGNRKLLGGVASGIAHYFSIDPLWIRLIFIVLVFDIFLTFSVSSILILSYIILWIVLPESKDLKEDKKLKKLYRNPEDRVLGGVASGIAVYFAADVVVIRLLFVLAIFLGGAGFLAYIILWIILPEATTITDKVQMKGEPVTLSNIESNIKSSLRVKEGEENLFIKILLFPFRLIAMLLQGIGNALGPIAKFLVDAIRIVAGLVFSLTGVSLLIALMVTIGVLIGLFSGNEHLALDGLPLDMLKGSFPLYGVIAAFVATGIPALALILGGIAIIIKGKSIHPSIGWTLFALWIISIGVLAVAGPGIITEFRSEGTHVVETTYDLDDKVAVLDLHEVGMEDYHATTLKLRGYDGTEFKLLQEFESRGRTRKDAIENAQMINYGVVLEDSVLVFDSNIQFRDNAQFRGQRLSMTLYIPYNHTFIISEDLQFIIYNTIYRYDYRISDMDRNNRWIFTEEGLECLTCEGSNRSSRSRSSDRQNTYTNTYDFNDFTDISISGPFKVWIKKGGYDIAASGRRDDMDKLDINQLGGRLKVDFDMNLTDINKDKESIQLNITLPDLEYLELQGASTSSVSGFISDYLRIDMSGLAESDIDISAREVRIRLEGASKLILYGNAEQLSADLSAATILDANSFRVKDASIKASPASSADLYVTGELDIDSSPAAKISIKGDPIIRRN